ncbi:MAG: restriction endonuclease subunit S [bacterium]
MVLEGWKIVELCDICEINPRTEVIDQGVAVVFLAMSSISCSGKVDRYSIKKRCDIGQGYTFFKKRDILIAKITPCFENGKGAFLNDMPTQFGFGSTEFHVLRAKEDLVLPEMLYHVTKSVHFRKHGEDNMEGSAGQQRVPVSFVQRYKCLLPPLMSQSIIVDALSTWDRAIEQTTRLIEAKRQLKRGLMQQLLTGKRRLSNFAYEPWHCIRIGKLFHERVDVGRDDLPLLSITADRGIVPRDDVEKRDTSSGDKARYKRIAPGDIGYNTMRMWQGVSALSLLEGIISPAYTVCIPRSGIDGQYAKHLFKYPPTVHEFWRHSQGMVDDTLNLKFPHFAEIKVHISTNILEQKAIAAILDMVDRQVTLLENSADVLKTQKQALMQKLLTGQVRVKVEVE